MTADATASELEEDVEALELRSSLPEESPFLASTYFKEAKLLLILAFFAILGVLARKGLIVLTTYEGAYLGGVVWANFAACVVMGLVIQSELVWLDRDTPKAQIALYTGLTTGFCGTCSSFSSLVLESFVKSANIEAGKSFKYPTAGYGVMECASVVIGQLAISIAGLHFGKHLMKKFDRRVPCVALVESCTAICGILAWIAVVSLIAIKSWRSWTFACIVGPIACWLRYYVSKWLNPQLRGFPLGTFAVNVSATVILAILNLLGRGKTAGGTGRIVNSILSCQMIQGLDDGFCGTLSTVSTFVVELYTLKSPRSYKYGFISVAVSYICMLLILGSYNWVHGLTDPLCS